MTNTELPPKTINALVLMRILIGWHFLYEGAVKLYNPSWTSKAYLMSAEHFTAFFQWIGSESIIGITDYFNVFALMFVGITLVLGYLEKPGALVGIGLLAMYYIAHPAFVDSMQKGTEGSYWLVNKNLIEAAALFVLYQIPTGKIFGLNRLSKSSSNPVTN